MRIIFSIPVLALLLSGCNMGTDVSTTELQLNAKDTKRAVNFGHNVIVAADLSNRILNQRKYEDPEVLKMITASLPILFQKSIDYGINDKFHFATVNPDDFTLFKYNPDIFKIDLTSFKTDEVRRSDYLYHNTGANSLSYDVSVMTDTFKTFYNRLKYGKQRGADVWYFFQDWLTFPVIDTSSKSYEYNGRTITNKYQNYIIVFTDGYIEAGRYGRDPNMADGNKFRYLSSDVVNSFRKALNVAGRSDYEKFFSEQGYGIMPVNNPALKNCKVLVLEIFDRSVKGGVTTQNPTDAEIIRLFWKDWLVNSGVATENIDIHNTFNNTQDLQYVLNRFFGL